MKGKHAIAVLLLGATVFYAGAKTVQADNCDGCLPVGPGVMCGSGETPKGKAARFAAAISGALRTLLPGDVWDKILPKIVDTSGDRVCYDDLGCFSATDGLTVPVSFPSSPESVNTQFQLYSRSNTQDAVLLDYKPGSVNEALVQFKERKPLKFWVPGWMDPTFIRLPAIKALLEKEDVNVILVNWNGGSFRINYLQSAGDTALVGRQMSVLVQNLMSVFPDTVNASDIHVIGDSLGAQVPGFFSKHLKKCTGQIIGRISELTLKRSGENEHTNHGEQRASRDGLVLDLRQAIV